MAAVGLGNFYFWQNTHGSRSTPYFQCPQQWRLPRATARWEAVHRVTALPEFWTLVAEHSGLVVGAWRLTGVCRVSREGRRLGCERCRGLLWCTAGVVGMVGVIIRGAACGRWIWRNFGWSPLLMSLFCCTNSPNVQRFDVASRRERARVFVNGCVSQCMRVLQRLCRLRLRFIFSF
jgi:hypothetical protein